jgi:hypothetical protein
MRVKQAQTEEQIQREIAKDEKLKGMLLLGDL